MWGKSAKFRALKLAKMTWHDVGREDIGASVPGTEMRTMRNLVDGLNIAARGILQLCKASFFVCGPDIEDRVRRRESRGPVWTFRHFWLCRRHL